MTAMRRNGLAKREPRHTNAGVKFTTFIPMRFVRHKANKVIVHPGLDGGPGARAGQGSAVDATLLKALSRAVFWQHLLDTGRVSSVADIAAAEGMDRVRVHKMLKLARLAPDIAQDIAGGREPVGLSQEFFIRRELPDDWNGQRRVFAELRR